MFVTIIGALAAILQIISLSIDSDSIITTSLARISFAIIFILSLLYFLRCSLPRLLPSAINKAIKKSIFLINQDEELVEEFIKLRKLVKDKAITKERNTDFSKTIFETNGKKYGIGYPGMDITWTIKDDGSAILHRRIHLIAYSRVSELDTFLSAPDQPTENIKYLRVISETPGIKVTKNQESKIAGRNSIMLTITPALKEGQELIYSMFETLPQNFYTILSGNSNGQVTTIDSFLPGDYIGWSINRPTKLLKLKVVFPPDCSEPHNYASHVHFAVDTGDFGIRKNDNELNRIGEPKMNGPIIDIDGEHFELSIDVKYPATGLVYLMNWEHPVKKTLN